MRPTGHAIDRDRSCLTRLHASSKRRLRTIRANRNENLPLVVRREPGDLFDLYSEDGTVGLRVKALQDLELAIFPRAANHPFAGERKEIVKNYAAMHPTFLQNRENAWRLPREPSSRPSEGRVLQQNPVAPPHRRFLLQLRERVTPSPFRPVDPNGFEYMAALRGSAAE